jgi:hypothetical protein
MMGRRSWGGGQGAGAISTVEQFLMRGLVTACQACVVGLPRSDPRRSVALPASSWSETRLGGTDVPPIFGAVEEPLFGCTK